MSDVIMNVKYDMQDVTTSNGCSIQVPSDFNSKVSPDISPFYHNSFEPTKPASVGSDGMIRLGRNNIHIQPIDNGFLVTIFDDECGIAVNCFHTFKEVMEFLDDNPILDKTMERVANNV